MRTRSKSYPDILQARWRRAVARGVIPLAFVGLVALPVAAQNPPQTEAPEAAVASRLAAVRAVVRLYDPLRPYLAPRIVEWHGSGVWLGEGQVLTDLQLVRFASHIEFWKPGKSRRSAGQLARLQHQGLDSGLAVIAAGSGPAKPVPASAPGLFAPAEAALPQPGTALEIVSVGDRSRNSGAVVERVNLQSIDSRAAILGSDIDFARVLKPAPLTDSRESRSGGPVFAGRQRIGIYIQERGLSGKQESAPRSYVLDARTVRAFLHDILADGRYDGVPDLGLHWSGLQSAAVRAELGPAARALKGGVLVRRIDAASPLRAKLRPGDVLTTIGGQSLDFAGRVGSGELLFEDWLRTRNDAARAVLVFAGLRAGQPFQIEADLRVEADRQRATRPGRLRRLDQPGYFLAGGLVFQELEYDLMHAREAVAGAGLPASEAEIRHRYYNYASERVQEQVDRDIVLTARLADAVNADAAAFVNGVVRSINGRRVRNLGDFAAEWRYTRNDAVVVEFLNRPQPLVISIKAAAESETRIRERYQVQENGRVRP